MTDSIESTPQDEAVYHLFADPEEVRPIASALRLLIDDVAHEATIRRYAREVLAQLPPGPPAPDGQPLTITLNAGEMKILHSAVRLLINDLGREEAEERKILLRVLDKLPDEHVIRAIQLD